MERISKLQPIAKIRKQQEDTAGRLHGESIRQAEHQKMQLDELLNYREEYAKSFRSASESGLSAIQMQEYQLFINRLDDAIRQQRQFVLNGQQKCDASQKEWMARRSKSKIINKVVENRQVSEKQARQRLEQKEMEDRPHKASGEH
jgi:flagellar FliJ protein